MNRPLLKILLFLLFATAVGIFGTKDVRAAGTFSLSPASGNYLKSCNQAVEVIIDVTSGQSNAADIIMTYDTSKIEILDALPSVAGIQLLPGNAYESYAGNSVNTTTGEIKLVGYSASSLLQSKAVFATILFKSLPSAATGGFTFTFSGANPYNTLDSNIADATTSYDMLSGVTNASYTFTNGSCTTDTTPPIITFVSPLNLANNVLPSSPVTIRITDAGIGVSLTSISVIINGKTYTSSSPEMSISGSPTSYLLTIVPSTPFMINAVSVISVTASDAAGNTKNSNASINTAFSCPITYITKIGNCPTATLLPTPKPDRESPKVTIISSTTIDVRKVFPLQILVEDNNGISPNSFVLTIGKQTYTLAATPERLKMEGTKNNYLFSIDLQPEELTLSEESKLVGSIKIADLEGNIRIEQLLFNTTGKPILPSTTKVVRTLQDYIASTLLYYIFPIGILVSLLILLILSAQPTIAKIHDNNKRLIAFPRGYYIYSNGTKHKLFGNFTGKLHGRVPHEAVQLVVQKYGFTTVSLPVKPTVKFEPQDITLTRI